MQTRPCEACGTTFTIDENASETKLCDRCLESGRARGEHESIAKSNESVAGTRPVDDEAAEGISTSSNQTSTKPKVILITPELVIASIFALVPILFFSLLAVAAFGVVAFVPLATLCALPFVFGWRFSWRSAASPKPLSAASEVVSAPPPLTTACECCGALVAELHARDSFKICNECLNFVERANIPIAELIAKKKAPKGDAKPTSKKEGSAASGCLVLIAIVVVVVCIGIVSQSPTSNQGSGGGTNQPAGSSSPGSGIDIGETVRKVVTPVVRKFQVPVKASMRSSMLPNMGQVLQIRNQGSVPLIDVVVWFGRDSEDFRTVIPRINPGDVVEVGGLGGQFEIILNPTMVFNIECDGYLPLVVKGPESK
jgi:hypothetical protein